MTAVRADARSADGVLNLSWQLFPIHGSYYDPVVTSLITTFMTVLVVVIWGPRDLVRHRAA